MREGWLYCLLAVAGCGKPTTSKMLSFREREIQGAMLPSDGNGSFNGCVGFPYLIHQLGRHSDCRDIV
uniref:Putative secreted protein n=1 Tax=Anopheles darlingi TaxID=43151 RepID=A0A2M4DJY4_ANODA